MQTDNKRRIFMKGAVASTAVVTAGMLIPNAVVAKWTAEAFEAKTVEDALKNTFESDALEESGDIAIKAPDIAENGAVVPVSVTTTIAGVNSITLLADSNGTPLLGTFHLGEGAEAYARTNIKMGKTGNVVAVVKAGDKLYSAKKEVKVTIGGCGG
jgi:sulfur-oxidizing protein SoxY